MSPIKKTKVGAKAATGSKAKNIIARRRNSAAKAGIGKPAFRSPAKIAAKSSEDEAVDNEEPSYEPSEDEINDDDDSTEEGSPTSSVAKSTKGKRVVAKPAKKMIYNKQLRRDATKFTTSQAMVDAEEEFDPRAAAFRGKATQSSGNGRKKGRRLIRWTGKHHTLTMLVYQKLTPFGLAQADQLLLLCLHHELARNKEELPYEAIAQRMFPEKNATGGAIKERFAKLRIECLNRGSWVPPILGKTPQNTRPDVRGVVRLAPGIDRGRFILWKEDASKLIDPKDINKGHVDAQKKGLQYPERIWINPGAEKEYLKSMHAHKALNLSPIAGTVPIDDDELLSDEDEEDEMEVVSDDGAAIPCTPKKRKAPVTINTSSKKLRAVDRTSQKKIAARGKAKQTEDSDYEGNTAGAGNSRFSSTKRPDVRRYRSPKSYVVTPSVESSDSNSAKMAESSDESEDDGSPIKKRLMMMAFDKDEEISRLRAVVVIRGLTPVALSKFPAGIRGPGGDDYADDEVAENCAAQYDGGTSIADDEVAENLSIQSDRSTSIADKDGKAVILSKDNLDIQFSENTEPVGQNRTMFERHYNMQDLLGAMKRNTNSNGNVINKDLWNNYLEQMKALTVGGGSQNPPHVQPHHQTLIRQYEQTQAHQNPIPQYEQTQAQNLFTLNGLGSYSAAFAGSNVNFESSPVDFGDPVFPPVQSGGIHGKTFQHDTRSFVENGLIDTAEYPKAKETGFNSDGNIKPDPVLAGPSGQGVKLAPAPGGQFLSFYDEYVGNERAASLNDSFGPFDAFEGHPRY